jgi:hypothetical protein
VCVGEGVLIAEDAMYELGYPTTHFPVNTHTLKRVLARHTLEQGLSTMCAIMTSQPPWLVPKIRI